MTTKKCKCTFVQRMVGDGCDVCNPDRALEYAATESGTTDIREETVGEANPLDQMVRLRDVIDVLSSDWSYLLGDTFIENQKPFHGPCCCCQVCGRSHDDCVCNHNELLFVLLSLGREDESRVL